MLTPQQFQEKHARRLKGALEDVRQGINSVTEAPTLKAAAKQQKMLARLTEAVNNGSWANGLKKVSLEDWKDKAANIGVNRISAGIDAASAKVIDFATQFLPAIQNAQAKISGMPDLTLDDSINRMNTYIRQIAQFKKK